MKIEPTGGILDVVSAPSNDQDTENLPTDKGLFSQLPKEDLQRKRGLNSEVEASFHSLISAAFWTNSNNLVSMFQVKDYTQSPLERDDCHHAPTIFITLKKLFRQFRRKKECKTKVPLTPTEQQIKGVPHFEVPHGHEKDCTPTQQKDTLRRPHVMLRSLSPLSLCFTEHRRE